MLVMMTISKNFSECAGLKKKCMPKKRDKCKRKITRSLRILKLLTLMIKPIKRLS